ncbi:hypothetical protein [Streptomyces blattellae]|uniref:hypothetical protein n=1 Tax=Streptomyces blattellae TaxID=2569855 RepID=UPI0012B7F784|nr:hypothetical protein [Streptomyces blattellae]
MADDKLFAVQGVDHAAGGAGTLDQFLAGDPQFLAVPLGVDEPGSADHPAFRRCGCDPAAVGAGTTFEVDVAEGQRHWTW